MRYLIHECNARKWYVDRFLIPSMLEQGIPTDYISVWLDKENKGNLFSCMESFLDCKNREGGTWHLQDDVIISRDFKKRTFKDFDEVVCGFCGKEISNVEQHGYVWPNRMWFSFPCIYIPNYISYECAEWFYREGQYEERFKERVSKGKSDDYIFLRFLVENHREDVDVINLRPNLVDHIDYILGGSVLNMQRKRDARSAHFVDSDLVEKLREEIKSYDREILLSNDQV